MTALGGDFNLARMERYLALVLESGATPVIVVNKADLTNYVIGPTGRLRGSISLCQFMQSARALGMARDLEQYFQGNRTVGLFGSSGVGKSTLTNRLLGRTAQATQEVRAHDGRGRHTTTHRQLFAPTGRWRDYRQPRPAWSRTLRIPRKAARAISMISRLWQPNADFAIVGTTMNRGARSALPLIGGP